MHFAVLLLNVLWKPLRFTPHCVRIFSLFCSCVYLLNHGLPLSAPYKSCFLNYRFFGGLHSCSSLCYSFTFRRTKLHLVVHTKATSACLDVATEHESDPFSFLPLLGSLMKTFREVCSQLFDWIYKQLKEVSRLQIGLSVFMSRIMWCYWSVSSIVSPRQCSADTGKSNMYKKQMLVDLTCYIRLLYCDNSIFEDSVQVLY